MNEELANARTHTHTSAVHTSQIKHEHMLYHAETMQRDSKTNH